MGALEYLFRAPILRRSGSWLGWGYWYLAVFTAICVRGAEPLPSTVHARVTTQKGVALENLRVRLLENGWEIQSALTDQLGRVDFNLQPREARYRLV